MSIASQPPMSVDTAYLIQALQSMSDKSTAQAKYMSDKTSKFMETLLLLNDRWSDQMITINVYKLFDIDSSYRNRIQYPLQSDFVIPYTNGNPGFNVFNAADPVANAFPYESGTTQAGSTTTDIVLSASSSSTNNFYIGNILDIDGQYSTIINYVGSTQTATVNPALSVSPAVGTPYRLRHAIPIVKDTLQAGSTQTIIKLPATFSDIDQIYTGTIILFNSGPDIGITRAISDYNGVSKEAVISPALPVEPGTDQFELEEFSRDNQIPLRYTGSRTINQPICYAIQLLQLTIPNLTLKVGYGGNISNYPYIYVHFYNDIKHSETTMYGNNPSANIATFRVSINSTISAATLATPKPNFFVFDNINLTAPQAVKFSPSESLRFKVTLPNGEYLQFIEPDNPSPEPINPIVQISALIGLKMIVTSPKQANV